MNPRLAPPLWLVGAISVMLAPGCRPAGSESPGSAKLPEVEDTERQKSEFRVLSVGELGRWGQGMEVSSGETARAFALSLNLDATGEFEQDVNVWCEKESKESIRYSGWSRYGGVLTFICVHGGPSLDSLRIGISVRQNLSEATSPDPVFRAVLDGRALERALANVQKALGSSGRWGRIKAVDYLAAEAELAREGVDIETKGRVWPETFVPF